MRDQSRRNKNHDSYAGKDRKSAQEEMDSRRTPSTVPQYVLDYAPFVYLYSQEEYWPCDIAKHLLHTTPYLNYTPAQAESDHAKLRNLDDLNEWGQYVYLTSNDNVIEHPIWLQGKSNIPSSKPQCKSDEESKRSDVESDDEDTETCSRRKAGHSEAPAVLIVVEKEDGVVDAFWFFFYSFNKGNTVFDLRFGNHIGDWEHTTVRFVDGEPSVVYLSEHDFGDAYTYEAVEKKGKRPVVYSAVGTHAMYPTAGSHPYVLPFELLHDETDRGPLWDPSLNLYAYDYNATSDTLHPNSLSPDAPTAWFDFEGHWGDKYYPLDDPRQYTFAGQYHYGSGPLGPKAKHLGNREVCEHDGECDVKSSTEAAHRIRFSRGSGMGEGEIPEKLELGPVEMEPEENEL